MRGRAPARRTGQTWRGAAPFTDESRRVRIVLDPRFERGGGCLPASLPACSFARSRSREHAARHGLDARAREEPPHVGAPDQDTAALRGARAARARLVRWHFWHGVFPGGPPLAVLDRRGPRSFVAPPWFRAVSPRAERARRARARCASSSPLARRGHGARGRAEKAEFGVRSSQHAAVPRRAARYFFPGGPRPLLACALTARFLFGLIQNHFHGSR